MCIKPAPPSILIAEVLFMSDFYNRNNRNKRKSRREKIGFYTAFSICLIAVCMAVYSTYNTLSVTDKTKKVQISETQAEPVNEVVTGVIETQVATEFDLTLPTVTSISQTETQPVSVEPTDDKTALETMLSTNLTLTYPLQTNKIIRGYSEDSVYFKTLNVWKPHTGVDFAGALGDDVFAMADGAVTKIYEDRMYGKSVEISINDTVCIYSGLGKIDVKKGDSVKAGDKIGVVGSVPFEASDENHIHISVKIGKEYADPLSFIGNNE
jgi:murein DD-endopeptidase MepM/ murein hydrolase activator NlpD